jgi:hypothetical protein
MYVFLLLRKQKEAHSQCPETRVQLLVPENNSIQFIEYNREIPGSCYGLVSICML